MTCRKIFEVCPSETRPPHHLQRVFRTLTGVTGESRRTEIFIFHFFMSVQDKPKDLGDGASVFAFISHG